MNAKTAAKKESEKRMLPFIRSGKKPFIAKKIGRNELCPCGSLKKVKNCHPEKLETEYFVKKTVKKAKAL